MVSEDGDSECNLLDSIPCQTMIFFRRKISGRQSPFSVSFFPFASATEWVFKNEQIDRNTFADSLKDLFQ